MSPVRFRFQKLGMLDRKLLRDLWSMKSQVFAISLVMAAGLATLVLSLGMIQSLADTRQAYYDHYRFADVFLNVKRAPDSLTRRIRQIPGVQEVESRVQLGATLDVPGLIEPASALLVSIPEGEQPKLNRLHLRQGRLVEPYRENEVVINEPFAEANDLGPGDTVTAIISGHQRTLEIVGVALSPEFVYWVPPGSLFPDNKRFAVMWMGRDGLEAAHDMDGAFNNLTISLMHDASIEAVIEAVDELARPYGGLGAYGREDQISDMIVRNELEELEAMAMIAPLIFLVISGFLLNTVLSRMIMLEREEIGTLKALGITGREVGVHYAKYAVVVAMLSAVIGTGLGIWFGRGMAAMYTEFLRFPELRYNLPFAVILAAVAVSLAAAFLGTFQAIRKVIRLRAAEAMRPEPPADYRPLLLERLGFSRFMSPVTRMICRHMERRGRRSVLTSLGIATALGMLIATSFVLDTIDFVLDVQFNQSAREDFGVSLIEASSRHALGDIDHLPGVVRSEPFRSVPVRLRAGHLSERVAILGLTNDAQLHRTLDKDLQPVEVPDEGLMLSDKLAEMLDVGPGEILTVEVLEGRRPTLQMPVSGVVQQYIGTGAFMDIGALNRAMLEGQSVSGAWVDVDEGARRDFFQAVKKTPAISGLSIREAAITGFNETMAENLIRMTLINISFAAIIAFGVVYNSARISVSERGRELASMRVLGFSRGEISMILLGELAILTVLAIPVGWVIGTGLAWLMVQGLDTEMFRIPLVIRSSTYAWTALVIIAAATFSALMVRRRLDRLNLVEVLKTRE